MAQLGTLVSRWISRLSRWVAVLAGLLLLFVVLFVPYGALMRYGFRAPISSVIELPSFLFLAITVLGMAYVQQTRGHIGVEFLVMRLNQKTKTVLSIVGHTLIIVYAGFAVWAGSVKTLSYLQHSERSVAMGVPLFLVELVLPLALALLCLQAAVEIGKDVTKLKSRAENP